MKTKIISFTLLLSLLLFKKTNAQTLIPVADSYVRSTSPSFNNGTVTTLWVRNGPVTDTAYLKFNIDGLNPIRTATLRISAKASSSWISDINVFEVADTNWTETGITWDNKPTIGSSFGQAIVTGDTYSWYEVSIDGHVRSQQNAGEKLLSLALHGTNAAANSGVGDIAFVLSREGASPPELVIVTNSPPTVSLTSPTTSSTSSAPCFVIQATAGDSDGTVAYVDFYANQVLIGRDYAAPYAFQWTNVTTGSNSFYAVAVDDLGLKATSAPPVSAWLFNVADLNTNGVIDILEDVQLASPVPFPGSPFVVTGAFEAEQFDAGGLGVGYSNVVSHPANNYRMTGMWITNCNDLVRGYAMRLFAGEWARYTLQVQTAGVYVVSARARGTNGGQIRFVFGNANNTANYVTNLVSFTDTSWCNLDCNVTLPTGANFLRVEGVTSTADLNHFSIYPAFPARPFPTNTIILGEGAYTDWVSGSTGTNFAVASANSATLQRAFDDLLPPDTRIGGTIQIPPGHYYLAQPSGQDGGTNSMVDAFAAVITRWQNSSNIRLVGSVDSTTGTNTTILMAHNRATTFFWINDQFRSHTNIAFENITFRGNPHIKTTNAIYEPGWYHNTAYFLSNTNVGNNCVGAGVPYTNTHTLIDTFHTRGVGSCILVSGEYPIDGLTIRHCDFINFPNIPIYIHNCHNVLIESNSFLMVNAYGEPNIILPALLDLVGPLPNNDGVTWNSPATGPAIFSGGASRVALLGNRFEGNPGLIRTNGQYKCADGIIWIQSGGHFYMRDNQVSRFGIEGVQYNSGPSASVGNSFDAVEENGTAAIVATTSHPTLNGDLMDYTHSVIGNSFVKVRRAVSSYDSNSVHFCGNYVSNSPPIAAANVLWCDADSTVVALGFSEFANISGNSVSNTAYAAGTVAKRAFILANDFSDIVRADLSAIWGSWARPAATIPWKGGSFTNIIIARSIIGAGADNPAHFGVNIPDAPQAFLLQNVYLDNTKSMVPHIVDPIDAPIIHDDF